MNEDAVCGKGCGLEPLGCKDCVGNLGSAEIESDVEEFINVDDELYEDEDSPEQIDDVTEKDLPPDEEYDYPESDETPLGEQLEGE